MKRIAFLAAMILTLATLTVLAGAQSRVLAVTEIPFNFSANDQDLPAGAYKLVQIGEHFVRLQHVSTNRGVTLITPQSIAEDPTTRIVFRRYGNRLFLAAVIAPSYQVSLPRSQKENDRRGNKIAMSTLTLKLSR